MIICSEPVPTGNGVGHSKQGRIDKSRIIEGLRFCRHIKKYLQKQNSSSTKQKINRIIILTDTEYSFINSSTNNENNWNHTSTMYTDFQSIVTFFFGGIGSISSSAANVQSWRWFVNYTVPTLWLDDDQFQIYLAFIIWITVMITGIGLETFSYHHLMPKSKSSDWYPTWQALWKLAQFLFPIFACISLGLAMQRNMLASFFVSTGLFKFGFPEMNIYFRHAFQAHPPPNDDTKPDACYLHYIDVTDPSPSEQQQERQRYNEYDYSVTTRLACFINGLGLLIHHGAASLVICMVLTGVITPSRHHIAVMVVLFMQHWFVLLKYHSVTLYSIIEFGLEMFFELSTFAHYEYILADHWIGAVCAMTMLIAHWLFLAASVIEVFIAPLLLSNKQKQEQVEAKHNMEESVMTANNVMHPSRRLSSSSSSSSSEQQLLHQDNNDGQWYDNHYSARNQDCRSVLHGQVIVQKADASEDNDTVSIITGMSTAYESQATNTSVRRRARRDGSQRIGSNRSLLRPSTLFSRKTYADRDGVTASSSSSPTRCHMVRWLSWNSKHQQQQKQQKQK